jgi:hypothetical protein
MEIFALIFSNLFLLYLLLGLVFAIAFLWRGAAKLDDKTKGSSWVFKALIIPGSMALWPVLLTKWIKNAK